MSSSSPKHKSQASSSSTTNMPSTSAPERTYFETQRAAWINEIAISMEHVLANINKLNRSLEGVIAVGNEFDSVEALWSQFENVMAKDPASTEEGDERGEEQTEYDEGRSEEATLRNPA